VHCTVSYENGVAEQILVEPLDDDFRVASIPFLADIYLDDVIACDVDATTGELQYRAVVRRGGHGKVLVKAVKATLQQILVALTSIQVLVDVDYDRALCALDLSHGRPSKNLAHWLAIEEESATLNYAIFSPDAESAVA